MLNLTPHDSLSSRLWQFLIIAFFFFSHNFDNFVEIWSCILLNVPQMGFSWYFPHGPIGLMIVFRGGDLRSNILFSSHHVCYQHDTSLLTLTLTTCWDSGCQVSIWWIPFLPYFHAVLLEWKSLCAAHTNGGGAMVHLFDRRVSLGAIWHYSAKICSFSHIYLLI